MYSFTHRIPEAWLSVCFAVRPCLRQALPAAVRARLHGPCDVARGGSGSGLWCLRPWSLVLSAGGGAGDARRMWDRGDVRRMKVGGSARSLILVWRVDPARELAPRARPGGGRLNRFRWVVLTTATGLELHAPRRLRADESNFFFSGATEQHSDDTPTADEREDSNRAGSSWAAARAAPVPAARRDAGTGLAVVRCVRACAPARPPAGANVSPLEINAAVFGVYLVYLVVYSQTSVCSLVIWLFGYIYKSSVRCPAPGRELAAGRSTTGGHARTNRQNCRQTPPREGLKTTAKRKRGGCSGAKSLRPERRRQVISYGKRDTRTCRM